jgi:hypothetical protein
VPNVTLAGNVHVSPAGLEADTTRLTVPVNPFSAVTVIVEVPDAPANIWAGVTALAAMVKSGPVPLTGTVTVRLRVPLVPVITTLKVGWAVVHPAVRVAVFGVGRVTEAGETVAVQPLGTTEVTAKEMLPVNPLSAFAVMVEVDVFGAV